MSESRTRSFHVSVIHTSQRQRTSTGLGMSTLLHEMYTAPPCPSGLTSEVGELLDEATWYTGALMHRAPQG